MSPQSQAQSQAKAPSKKSALAQRRLEAPPALAGALLVFLGLLGTFLPIITAFNLPVQLPLLLLSGALLTVYITTMFSVRRMAWLMLLLLAGAWGFVCFEWQEMLRVGAQVTVAGVMNELALGLDFISEIALPSGIAEAERVAGCTLFLAELMAPLLLLYGWSIVYLSSAAPCVVVSLPFFMVSMILMDRPPSLLSVLFTIAFWALLLLPQAVRRASPRRGAGLTLLYVPIVAVLCALVLLLSPRENYVRAAWPDVLRERITSIQGPASDDGTGVQMPSFAETVQQVTASRPDTDVNVSSLGPRRTTGTEVLQLYDSHGGTLYLRGSALGRYDGATWRETATKPPESAGSAAQFSATAVSGQGNRRTITIRHLSGTTQLAYMPYFALFGEAESGEVYARPKNRTDTYEWTYTPYSGGMASFSGSGSEAEKLYGAWAQGAYTDLPEGLATQLRQIAEDAGIDASASREAVVSQVTAYIRQAGYYDLEAERAPNGSDFILYFLTESHRGYCVHFASAAASMLQSLGVPARYVSGYLVQVSASSWSTVTDEDAHAWVEVYFDGFGWVPIEVTGSTTAPAETPTPSDAPTQNPDAAVTDGPEETSDPGNPEWTPGASDAPAQTGAIPNDNPPPAGSPGTGTPGEGDQDPYAPPAPRDPVSPLWLLLLVPPALVGALVLRRREILKRRAHRLRSGGNKKRILAAWRELQRICRYGVEIPAGLEAIALEARFSNHEMSDAQREQLLRFLEQERARLTESLPALKRLVAQYVRAVL